MGAKSLQSCPTLCDPMDYSLPGSSVHGILQARILEWVAVPSCRGLLDSRMEPCLTSPALTGRLFPTSATWEGNHKIIHKYLKYINLNILSVNNVLYKKMCLSLCKKTRLFF